MKKTFKCVVCNAEFQEMFESGKKQALGCSTELYIDDNGDRYLMGFYGSTVADGSKFSASDALPDTGNVCDSCVKKFIDSGDLVLIEENLYFGENVETIELNVNDFGGNHDECLSEGW